MIISFYSCYFYVKNNKIYSVSNSKNQLINNKKITKNNLTNLRNFFFLSKKNEFDNFCVLLYFRSQAIKYYRWAIERQKHIRLRWILCWCRNSFHTPVSPLIMSLKKVSAPSLLLIIRKKPKEAVVENFMMLGLNIDYNKNRTTKTIVTFRVKATFANNIGVCFSGWNVLVLVLFIFAVFLIDKTKFWQKLICKKLQQFLLIINLTV